MKMRKNYYFITNASVSGDNTTNFRERYNVVSHYFYYKPLLRGDCIVYDNSELLSHLFEPGLFSNGENKERYFVIVPDLKKEEHLNPLRFAKYTDVFSRPAKRTVLLQHFFKNWGVAYYNENNQTRIPPSERQILQPDTLLRRPAFFSDTKYNIVSSYGAL